MKTKKPTGDGICPPEIQQAHYIDGLINEWASTHNLGNSDFNDVKGDKTEPLTDDDNIPAVEPCVAVAYSSCNNVPVPWYTACGTTATELLNSLSNAFDPAVQSAHDEDQASQLLANIQLLTVSQQLQDAQACNDKLHGQLFNLHNHLHEFQQATDHAKLYLKMIHVPLAQERQIYHNMLKKRCQSYRWFADGGEAYAWLDDDDNEDQWGAMKQEVDEDNVYPNRYANKAGPSHSKVFKGTPEL